MLGSQLAGDVSHKPGGRLPLLFSRCKDRFLYEGFISLLAKLSDNIDVSVNFRWSFTLAKFETIAETTQ